MDIALKQGDFEMVHDLLTTSNSLNVPMATTIIEHILKNFGRTNWENKNNCINIILKQFVTKLIFKDCTELLINNILKLLKLFHHSKIETKYSKVNWATIIFEQLDKQLLSEIEISESTILHMINMQHKGVVQILVIHNKYAYSYVVKNPLKFLQKACEHNYEFSADIIIFLIETFCPGDFSIKIAETIAHGINYEARVYAG